LINFLQFKKGKRGLAKFENKKCKNNYVFFFKTEGEDNIVIKHLSKSLKFTPYSFGLSATSQQYFSLTTNQPPATSQQYSSLRTNQHQPSATSQPNGLLSWVKPHLIVHFYLSPRMQSQGPILTLQLNTRVVTTTSAAKHAYSIRRKQRYQ
jgi:hypothetical protein